MIRGCRDIAVHHIVEDEHHGVCLMYGTFSGWNFICSMDTLTLFGHERLRWIQSLLYPLPVPPEFHRMLPRACISCTVVHTALPLVCKATQRGSIHLNLSEST